MENQRIIQVEDKVPFKLLVPLSIQHMFAMFGASILVPSCFCTVLPPQTRRSSMSC